MNLCQGLPFPDLLHGIMHLCNTVCQSSRTLPTGLAVVHLLSRQRPRKHKSKNFHQSHIFSCLVVEPGTSICGSSFHPTHTWCDLVRHKTYWLGIPPGELHPSPKCAWTSHETRMHINLLELRAVRLVCNAFLPLISSHHVQIISDNMTLT